MEKSFSQPTNGEPLKMRPTVNARDRDDNFLVERLSLLVEPIAKTFGPHCEVVMHDLRQLEESVIKIEHGHITGRTIGSSVTDLALKNLKENITNDQLLNYQSTTKDGRTLKSTTVIIRNKQNLPIAALCINIDITDLKSAWSFIDQICYIGEREEMGETFETDMNTTISTTIDKTIAACHLTVPAMKKGDRMKITATLDEQGVFLVKGAVKIVAKKLNVSKYAVYNYLEELKAAGTGL